MRTASGARPGVRAIVLFWLLCLLPLADALTRVDVHEPAPGAWHGALSTMAGSPILLVERRASGDGALPAAGRRLAIAAPPLGVTYEGAWRGVHRLTFGAGAPATCSAPAVDVACGERAMDDRGSRRP